MRIVTLILGFLGVIVSIFNQNKRFDDMKERFNDLRDAVKKLRDSMNHRFDDRMDGRRELVFPPLPYIAVYGVTAGAVEVSHIVDGAQDWP